MDPKPFSSSALPSQKQAPYSIGEPPFIQLQSFLQPPLPYTPPLQHPFYYPNTYSNQLDHRPPWSQPISPFQHNSQYQNIPIQNNHAIDLINDRLKTFEKSLTTQILKSSNETELLIKSSFDHLQDGFINTINRIESIERSLPTIFLHAIKESGFLVRLDAVEKSLESLNSKLSNIPTMSTIEELFSKYQTAKISTYKPSLVFPDLPESPRLSNITETFLPEFNEFEDVLSNFSNEDDNNIDRENVEIHEDEEMVERIGNLDDREHFSEDDDDVKEEVFEKIKTVSTNLKPRIIVNNVKLLPVSKKAANKCFRCSKNHKTCDQTLPECGYCLKNRLNGDKKFKTYLGLPCCYDLNFNPKTDIWPDSQDLNQNDEILENNVPTKERRLSDDEEVVDEAKFYLKTRSSIAEPQTASFDKNLTPKCYRCFTSGKICDQALPECGRCKRIRLNNYRGVTKYPWLNCCYDLNFDPVTDAWPCIEEEGIVENTSPPSIVALKNSSSLYLATNNLSNDEEIVDEMDYRTTKSNQIIVPNPQKSVSKSKNKCYRCRASGRNCDRKLPECGCCKKTRLNNYRGIKRYPGLPCCYDLDFDPEKDHWTPTNGGIQIEEDIVLEVHVNDINEQDEEKSKHMNEENHDLESALIHTNSVFGQSKEKATNKCFRCRTLSSKRICDRKLPECGCCKKTRLNNYRGIKMYPGLPCCYDLDFDPAKDPWPKPYLKNLVVEESSSEEKLIIEETLIKVSSIPHGPFSDEIQEDGINNQDDFVYNVVSVSLPELQKMAPNKCYRCRCIRKTDCDKKLPECGSCLKSRLNNYRSIKKYPGLPCCYDMNFDPDTDEWRQPYFTDSIGEEKNNENSTEIFAEQTSLEISEPLQQNTSESTPNGYFPSRVFNWINSYSTMKESLFKTPDAVVSGPLRVERGNGRTAPY